MNEGSTADLPENLTEINETIKHGRTLNLVLLHNFELDKNTGEPKITQDPEKFQRLIEHIGGKGEIVKIYNGVPKENDAKAAVTQKTTDLLAEAMEEQGKSVRPTRRRDELQRLPGTPEYYSYLADKSREENPDLADLEEGEVLAQTGAAIYDLWRKYPDPKGEIPSAKEVNARFNQIIQRLKKIAERSPSDYPDATLILIVDRAIQGWLFNQTGITSAEIGKIQDDEPIEMTFSGDPKDQPMFSFKGEEYQIKLENQEA